MNHTLSLATLAVLPLLASCTTERGFPARHGIRNYDRVDDHLVRGAMPNFESLCWLYERGVTDIIDLTPASEKWIDEAGHCKAIGLRYHNFPMSGLVAPNTETVRMILDCIEGNKLSFIHCKYGADRTGTIVACWKIDHGEDNKAALNDAFMHGLSPLLAQHTHLIRDWKPK